LILIVAIVSIIALAASFSLSNNFSSNTNSSTTIQTSESITQSNIAASNSSAQSIACFNCVTISTVYLNIESQDMNSACWNQGPLISTQYLGSVLSPNITGSARMFSYTLSFMASTNNMQDIGMCGSMGTIVNITLSNSPPVPFTIDSVSPALPYSINAGNEVVFTLGFEASNQSYEGPITIVMLMA